jgi:hypothetical protein
MGDIDHGSDNYYLDWAERQQEREDQRREDEV